MASRAGQHNDPGIIAVDAVFAHGQSLARAPTRPALWLAS
jgi:hypothetical protein